MAFELVDLDRQGTRGMKIIFVRHGEPDYRELEERSYTIWIDWHPCLIRDKSPEIEHQSFTPSAEIIIIFWESQEL